MNKKIAVLIDWENVRKGIFESAAYKIHKKVDYNNTDNLTQLIKSFIAYPEEDIYRIFLYLSAPIDKYSYCGNTYDLTKEPAYLSHMNFIKKIGPLDYIALRKGKLKFRGIDKQNKPIFIQKQVDMLIGLDIAHLAYTKNVDRILILSADTDIIPALKVARINGLQVVLGYCPDIQNISNDLKLHADFIRGKDFLTIF